MADVSLPKRQREEDEISLELEENPQDLMKRQRTYNQLLSILEEDEEDLSTTDNLSDIFTTLQQELSSSAEFSLSFDNMSLPNFDVPEAGQEPHATTSSSTKSMLQIGKEEDERYNDVMRHLLEASDDELGLPGNGGDSGTICDTNIFVNDGLFQFEFEDENANYFAMLQSELFM